MLGGILVMGGLGMAVGVGLALASKIFYVWVDPKVEAIDEALPGANCGGCGLPGCSANAEAIVKGKASASSCVRMPRSTRRPLRSGPCDVLPSALRQLSMSSRDTMPWWTSRAARWMSSWVGKGSPRAHRLEAGR